MEVAGSSAPLLRQAFHEVSILEIFPLAIVLLDKRSQIFQLNAAAQRIIQQADGLDIIHNRLVCTQSRDNRDLQERIRGEIEGGRSNTSTQSKILKVARISRQRAFELLVTSFSGSAATNSRRATPAVAALIRDPGNAAPLQCERLRHIYGLTPTETRIAQGLALGKTVSELAHALKIQTNTVRIHLKRIYSKTETRGQSELVHFLASNWLLSM